MSKRFTFVRNIDRLNEGVGSLTAWLVPVVILLGAWNAVARYVSKFTGLNLSSNAYLEMQWYLFSIIFLLGSAYTLKRNEHVRVDVWYTNRSPRTQARIDRIGTLLFLIPFCIFILWSSWFPVVNSWQIKEMSSDPGGLARYPIKTLIPVAFVLVLLQGIARLVQHSTFNSQLPTSKLPTPDTRHPSTKGDSL